MLLIASYTLLESGPILGPEVPWEFIFDGQKPSKSVRRSQEDDLLQLTNFTGSRDIS